MSYQWHWEVFFSPLPSGEGIYLDWLREGMLWTVGLSLSAWMVALLLGGMVGVVRTLPIRWLARCATLYVEMFRNVPLLVQLFVWYFVFPELLPPSMAQALKSWDPLWQQFIAAWLCLGLFTSARVAEQVRAGIQSIPYGQWQSGLAIGLTLSQLYRFILLPRALRLILPTLTSEFLNIFKNSAVAATIGLIELSRQAQQMLDYTAQPYESFLAVTACYLLINMTVLMGMHRVEQAMQKRF